MTKRFATAVLTAVLLGGPATLARQATLQTPEQYFGFRIGADNKLARWDKIVDYMKLVSADSDRVRFRELGKTTNGNPFIALEIASADTLKNLDHYKQLERKLYFQDGAPTDAERDEIFRQGKAVVVITNSIHATEIGASQMVVELVHRLATDDSPQVKKILDNVIFVLVPCLNPDGQIMVTDWFNKNLGTPFETSQIPYLYHPYVGHDNNRDMYMFTQKESQLTATLLWHDWYPSVWLDEHQMGSNAARIFVMPATDPINPNVHPLIYRWNGILGQSQAAALEAEGKEGIIYNSTYTNFWEGAMAWAGWWHNEVGLLTEVASVRVAAPIDQQRATPRSTSSGQAGQQPAGGRGGQGGRGGGILPPPTDITPRTEYPRPWMGGHWTLRDIVDYELTATMALLDTAADRREALLRQIYEVNRVTVENGRKGDPLAAILIPVETQHDPHEAVHLVEKLQEGGVDVYRAGAGFQADGTSYPAGTFVVPMDQVFARYAKDMLEKQTYPEVRRSPTSPPEPPYDVTAWSLGMLLGVDHVMVRHPLGTEAALTKLDAAPKLPGGVTGAGPRFAFDYRGPDAAKAVNRLLKDGAKLALDASRVWVTSAPRASLEAVASELGLRIAAADGAVPSTALALKAPRVGMYSPWTGGNMDEGWTRWVLEQYRLQPHDAPQRRDARRQPPGQVRRRDPARSEPAIDRRRRQRREHPARVSGRDRRRGRGGAARVRRQGRHARHPRRRVGSRDRPARRAGQEPERRPVARRALRAGHDPQRRSRQRVADGLRHAAGDDRVLQQQPVLQPARRVLVAEAERHRALSQQRRRGVGLAEGRGADGGPGRGGERRHEGGPHRALRSAAAAPRADARDLPAALQHAIPVGS